MLNKESFKGFSLFTDIQDAELRNRNRAVVLSNIAIDNTRNKKISTKGASLILGYFGIIPQEERADVQERFKQRMMESGFELQ